MGVVELVGCRKCPVEASGGMPAEVLLPLPKIWAAFTPSREAATTQKVGRTVGAGGERGEEWAVGAVDVLLGVLAGRRLWEMSTKLAVLVLDVGLGVGVAVGAVGVPAGRSERLGTGCMLMADTVGTDTETGRPWGMLDMRLRAHKSAGEGM